MSVTEKRVNDNLFFYNEYDAYTYEYVKLIPTFRDSAIFLGRIWRFFMTKFIYLFLWINFHCNIKVIGYGRSELQKANAE